jgi:spermidine/putrescine transport system permease protein
MTLETRAKLSGFLLALPTIFWLSVFFLLPLISIVGFSFMSRGAGGAPVWPLTLDNYDDSIRGVYGQVLVRSIRISFVSTIACLVVGYPLAFYIGTRKNEWVKNATLFLVILPFWTNFLVRTYAWRILMGQEGVINSFLMWLGVISPDAPLQLLNTEFAVIVGLIYAYLPFMVLPIYASVERFNFRYVEAAHDLGANDWWAFWRVVFPLTLPGVFAGIALVFIPVVGAYVTPDMLGGTKGLMIGNLIENQFFGNGNIPRGAALSVVMMGVVMGTLMLYVWKAPVNWLSTQFSKLHNIFKLLIVLGLVGIFDYFTDDPTYIAQIGENSVPILSFFGFIELLIVLYLIYEVWRYFQKGKQKVENQLARHDKAAIDRDMLLRKLGTIGLYLNPVFSYFFLWAPIVILVIFSFNESRSVSVFTGATTKWYQNLFSGVVGTEVNFTTGELLESLQNSLWVAFAATIASTIFGTMVALGLSRSNFPGKRILDGIMLLPVVIPEITQGFSLAIFFNMLWDWASAIAGHRVVPAPVLVNIPLLDFHFMFNMAFFPIIIGHIAFNISFVAIVVRARLADMNPRYEEAARDLGANNWQTFWKVTFPLIFPGIIAGALLAFTLSLDDYVITLFTSGVGTTTLPIFVYGLLKLSVTPEINAISTLLLVFSTILIGISLALQGRNAAKV